MTILWVMTATSPDGREHDFKKRAPVERVAQDWLEDWLRRNKPGWTVTRTRREATPYQTVA
jgi:hypothetical protein